MASIAPLITFKAGKCEVDDSSKPYKVTPLPAAGYIYLYFEDDFVHFCWRERSAPLDSPDIDLIMVPSDSSFTTYESPDGQSAYTNGRIVVLKFLSSSTRYLFWLQSKAQGPRGNRDPSYFSPRDRRITKIVNLLLQGEEVDVARALAEISDQEDEHDDDGDATMEDSQGHRNSNEPHGGSGGAGADATGGDVREEGEDAREGGADGARA